MEAYGVFEGGGAKGYAHLGALKAAEERGIRFRAVAGTSAGAIIAALYAAGYAADDLLAIDADPPSGVLHVNPMDVLDAEEYARVRSLFNHVSALRSGAPSGLAGVVRRLLGSRRYERFAGSVWGIILGQILVARRHRAAMRLAASRQGLNDIERVVDWLEGLLRNRIKPANGSHVAFSDLPIPLRVVAAELGAERLREFGGEGDEGLSVARAVAASACFPLFFRPLAMNGELFVDGGLVSNLPVWIFDRERDDDPSFLPTFGFRLMPVEPDADGPGGADGLEDAKSVGVAPPPLTLTLVDFAGRLFRTLQSGAPSLQERRIDDYYAIDLTTRISTLAFHELPARAVEVAREGRDCVIAFFERAIGPQDPGEMAEVLRRMVLLLRDRYRWNDSRVRASVLLPDGEDARWARTAYSTNMERDADDRLRVRLDGTLGVGAAFARREPVYLVRGRMDVREAGLDRYEIGVRPSEIGASYSIPVFREPDAWLQADPAAREAPFALLVIDKELPFDDLMSDPVEQDALANVAAIIGGRVRGRDVVRRVSQGRPPDRSKVGLERIDNAGGVMVSARKERDVGDGELARAMWRVVAEIGPASVPLSQSSDEQADGNP